MDALDAIFGNVTACTARLKAERDGKTFTAVMLRGVTDKTEEAIGEAAAHGTNFSWRAEVNGRPLSNKRDDTVSGAAARSAVYAMLGYSPAPAPTDTAADPVPPATRSRGRSVAPSTNGTHDTAK